MTQAAEKKVNDNAAIWVSRKAGTVALAHECQAMTPRDEYGRTIPMYGIVHKALEMYKAEMKARKGK
jgi:hypothetical protein